MTALSDDHAFSTILHVVANVDTMPRHELIGAARILAMHSLTRLSDEALRDEVRTVIGAWKVACDEEAARYYDVFGFYPDWYTR